MEESNPISEWRRKLFAQLTGTGSAAVTLLRDGEKSSGNTDDAGVQESGRSEAIPPPDPAAGESAMAPSTASSALAAPESHEPALPEETPSAANSVTAIQTETTGSTGSAGIGQIAEVLETHLRLTRRISTRLGRDEELYR